MQAREALERANAEKIAEAQAMAAAVASLDQARAERDTAVRACAALTQRAEDETAAAQAEAQRHAKELRMMRASVQTGFEARGAAEDAAKTATLESAAAQLEMRRATEAAAKLAIDVQEMKAEKEAMLQTIVRLSPDGKGLQELHALILAGKKIEGSIPLD